MKKAFIFAVALLLLPLSAMAASPKVSATALKQGDTLVVSLPLKPAVTGATFNGEPVYFFPYQGGQRAVVGISPTATPGAYNLRIARKASLPYKKTIAIRKKDFPVVILGVPDTINETPDQVVKGFGDINTVLNKIVADRTAAAFTGTFQMPVASFTRYGSPFGEIRKTGDNLVRHLGTDFTAPVGTPVVAVNSGTVRLAEMTDLYGNTIVIDHGAGIYSLYLHLSRMDVTVGDKVQKGKTIGAVGQTGYAFGPHLHFSLKINGSSVDPVIFINSFK